MRLGQKYFKTKKSITHISQEEKKNFHKHIFYNTPIFFTLKQVNNKQYNLSFFYYKRFKTQKQSYCMEYSLLPLFKSNNDKHMIITIMDNKG